MRINFLSHRYRLLWLFVSVQGGAGFYGERSVSLLVPERLGVYFFIAKSAPVYESPPGSISFVRTFNL
jgi:hypothetical protein